MKPNLLFVNSQLEEIKQNNLYRSLRFGTIKESYITINNNKLLNLCSNDYLGITPGKISSSQMQSSSRLVSGNDDSYFELERKLSRHKSQQSALIYPTGYMANLGSIPTIIQKEDLILSDSLNHASIIEACKLSNAKISIYKHNDMDDLQSKLNQKYKQKFIITEGIFSMDGDFAKIKEITEIAQKNNAVTILDDAHGDFTVGNDGKGTADHFGVAKKIDLYISSLSKGLGSFGGYLTSQKNVIDLCINKSKTFIYTSALPSFLVEYSSKRMDSNREVKRKKLEKNVKKMRCGLIELGYKIKSNTHIIPIMIGDEKKAIKFGNSLMKERIFAQPIRYPTVPKNKARIRLSITAWLSQKQIEDALTVFQQVGRKFEMF